MRLVHKDIAAGIAFIILAVAYWLGADNIPKSLLEGGVGAEALPKMLGVMLLVLAAILVLQTALAGRRLKGSAEAPDGDDEEEGPPQSKFYRHKRAAGILLIGIGYIFIVEFVGYALAIAYLLGAVLWYAGGASRRTVTIFAVIGAVFFWLLFVETLGIRQPQGFWPKLWHQISHAETTSAAKPVGTATL